MTAATRLLRSEGVQYAEHPYDYVAGGGAAGGAAELGIDPHRVIKTLILVTSEGDSICVLMHGDREVSLKRLARQIGVKSVAMAPATDANRASGYQVGGTSPFGLRTDMPVYCETSVTDYAAIVINGGKRGFLIELAVPDLLHLLQPILVNVAV